MKKISKYSFLILPAVLIIITVFAYIDYKQLLKQIEKNDLLIDVMFNGWIVAFSFLILSLYELMINNRHLKLLVRILLILLFLGNIFKNVITVDDFDAVVENATIFAGIVAVILILLLVLKWMYDKKYKLPAANKRYK